MWTFQDFHRVIARNISLERFFHWNKIFTWERRVRWKGSWQNPLIEIFSFDYMSVIWTGSLSNSRRSQVDMDRNHSEWLISHSCRVCQPLRPCTTHPPFLHSVVSQGGIISGHISSWCCLNTILIFSISLLSWRNPFWFNSGRCWARFVVDFNNAWSNTRGGWVLKCPYILIYTL